MATFYGSGATNYLNSSPPKLIEKGELYGRMRVHYDEFVLTAALTSGDVIKMGGLLPADHRLMHVEVDTTDLDSGSTGAFTYGYAASADGVEVADADGFMDSVDAHTAAKAVGSEVKTVATIAAKFKKFAAAVQPQIAVTGTGDATSGTIRCALYFIVD